MVAISAVAEQMSLILDDEYVAGLWKNDMIRGLLWWSMQGGYLKPRRLEGKDYVAPSWSWASLEHGAVLTLLSRTLDQGVLVCGDMITPGFIDCDYTGVEEMPLNASSDIEILSVQCRTRESPFGQVQSGTIRMKGYICEVSWIFSGEDDSLLGLTCLRMARYISNQEERADYLDGSEDTRRFGKCICLALLPTEFRENEYRRVGLAEIDYWRWEEEDKQEILLI
ncbi:hypothetical protein FSARC_1660 [Fusarium sarcochroum]|uniref:Heterokaryon incompatibility protein n=1 Tax=Fusarium sarcochroum TaxID=1208366 RepID=A0A8H4XET8_9HYPO|nr:hypothetical protein FSARC_1660 [Fusarium sarcochroum]